MTDLIERYKITANLPSVLMNYCNRFNSKQLESITEMIYELENSIESADVQTVKHGRWIKCDYKRLDDAGEVQTYIGQGVYCSKCRTGFHKNEVKNWIGCPCCLTRMDGDTNG